MTMARFLPPPAAILFLLCFINFLLVPTFCYASSFLNIDCGSNQSLTDPRNLTWVGDQDYVGTGEAMIVPGFNRPKWPQMQTLRVFKSRKKNCYTIPMKNGTKILARAYFYYGNYDSKNNPPEMDVLFDADLWTTMETTLDDIWYTERIYVTGRNSTSICVARRKANQDPFVSAIDVRILPSDMYEGVDSTKALNNYARNAYGSVNTTRYPDDKYDRFWNPVKENYTVLTSDTTVMDNSIAEVPPKKVLLSAVGPPNGTNILTIPFSFLRSVAFPVYYLMYFTEMSDLSSKGKTRSFDAYMDGIQVGFSEALVPPYQGVLEGSSIGSNLSASNVLTLHPTMTSTLPPIISALEVYLIIDVNLRTRDSDVVALSTLQENFKVLKEWSGDPCLPENFNWEWVSCSATITPTITQLILAGYGLQGRLPDFTTLTELEIIDLHNNSLTGPIPEFFNRFPKLRILNLGYNKFTSVPVSLINNKKIQLNVTGNPFNTPPPSPSTPKTPTAPKNPKHVPPPPNGGNKAKTSLFSLFFIAILFFI